MADPAILAEAFKRGLLPPDQAAAYQEAQKRGLLGSDPTPAPQPQNVLGDALSGLAAPFVKLGHDVAADYQAKTTAKVPTSLGQAVTDELKSLGGTAGILGDVLGLTSAPVQAAVRPVAGAISRTGLPIYSKPSLSLSGGLHIAPAQRLNQPDAQAAIEGDLNTALSAMRPAGATAPIQGPAQPMVRSAATQAPPMSIDQLQAAKTAAYKAVDTAGVQYTPQAVNGMISNIGQDLTAANISPMRHPRAASMMDDIASLSGQPQSLTQIDQLRQVVRRDVASSNDPAEAHFGRKIINGIDQFIETAGPGDVSAGNAADASTAIQTARDLNSRFRKVEAVTDAVDKAQRRAGSTGSGGNVDNATRQNLRRLLENSHNLSDDEVSALNSAVMGDPVQNVMRMVGKLSPSGNGLMGALNLGSAAMGGPLGAVPGALGIGAKIAADATTGRKVRDLLNLMAVGGQRSALPGAEFPQFAIPSPRAMIGVGVAGSPAATLPSALVSQPPAKAARSAPRR